MLRLLLVATSILAVAADVLPTVWVTDEKTGNEQTMTSSELEVAGLLSRSHRRYPISARDVVKEAEEEAAAEEWAAEAYAGMWAECSVRGATLALERAEPAPSGTKPEPKTKSKPRRG